MGGAALEDDSMTGAMSAAVYSGTDYVLLLFVILSTVLVIIGAISLMSGLAKSVKEAGTMVSPLMIVVHADRCVDDVRGWCAEGGLLVSDPVL